jgi:hypothetical protein
MRHRLKCYSIGVVVLFIFGFLCLSSPLSAQAGPDVTVINTPDNPVPVVIENSSGQEKVPIQISFVFNNEPVNHYYPIPPGKMVVIEFIASYITDYPGGTAMPVIYLILDSQYILFHYKKDSIGYSGVNNLDIYNQKVLLFAFDELSLNSDGVVYSGVAVISGYLVNEPL